MKPLIHHTIWILLVAFCFAASSCGHLPPSKRTYKPQGEGYGYVRLTYHRDMYHKSSRNDFFYWDKDGKRTLVWRELSSHMQSGPDMAVFKGYLYHGPLRLFAVQGTGPVVDVTDDVIRLWIKSDDKKFLEVIKCPLVGKLTQNAGLITVELHGWKDEHGSAKIELDRDQILNMLQQGREKGKPMKDPGTGRPYLKRDWESELQKP